MGSAIFLGVWKKPMRFNLFGSQSAEEFPKQGRMGGRFKLRPEFIVAKNDLTRVGDNEAETFLLESGCTVQISVLKEGEHRIDGH